MVPETSPRGFSRNNPCMESPTQGTHVTLRKEGTGLARDKGAGLCSLLLDSVNIFASRGDCPHMPTCAGAT